MPLLASVTQIQWTSENLHSPVSVYLLGPPPAVSLEERTVTNTEEGDDLDKDGRTIIIAQGLADGILPGRMIRLGSDLPTAGSLLATIGSGSEFQTNNLSPGEGYSIEARTCVSFVSFSLSSLYVIILGFPFNQVSKRKSTASTSLQLPLGVSTAPIWSEGDFDPEVTRPIRRFPLIPRKTPQIRTGDRSPFAGVAQTGVVHFSDQNVYGCLLAANDWSIHYQFSLGMI